MKIELQKEPTYEQALYIAENLRERDRQEIFATRYDESIEGLARDTVALGGFSWVALVDGVPVAVIGATPRWPKVWGIWSYGTNDWDKVVLTLTRHALRFMRPALYNSGAIRVDCMALAAHTDARRWLEYLGLRPEKKLDKWGKNGETFVSYCWTRKQTNF